MAKKLIDIRKQIESNEIAFKAHLEKSLDKDVFYLLNKLSINCHVYIFSGIIRNYFLKIDDLRDVDIFIEGTIDLENIISNYKYRKNSFGGYKITINETNIDLWFLQDTWALNNSQTALDFDLAKYIPNTAFFNFSSIMFSFNENKFYYTKYFTRFLRDKKIDLVFIPNANYSLCVINSLYYSDKFKLKLTNKLKSYIKQLHHTTRGKYYETQLKHFGEIIYSNEEIEDRISTMEIIKSKTINTSKTPYEQSTVLKFDNENKYEE